MAMNEFHRWKPSPQDLTNMTPAKALDLIIKCFFEAQKETIVRVKERLHKPVDEKKIHDTVTGFIHGQFKSSGFDFNRPTKENLAAIVEILGRVSPTWGTPVDVVEYHKTQIKKILNLI